MSEARRLRRRIASRAIRTARVAAQAQGCACAVELAVESWSGAMPNVVLRHDDWCPLLRVMEERPPGPARMMVLFRRDVGGEQRRLNDLVREEGS